MGTETVTVRASELRYLARAVIAVVWQREVSTRRYPAGFWAAVVTPFLSLASSVFLAEAFLGRGDVLPTAGDFRAFLLVSAIVWEFIDCQLHFGFAVESEMRRGTLETLMLTPVPRWCVLLGHAAFSFLRSTIAVVLTALLGVAAFGVSGLPPLGPLAAALGLNLVLVLGYGLMVAAGIICFRSGAFSYIVDTLLPLVVGETYSVTVLPPMLRSVSRIIPLTYGLDMVRAVASGSLPLLSIRLEATIVAVSAPVMIASGLWAFRKLESLARMRGTFGQF